jgi:phosphoribosylamine--glycine ligase
MNPLNVLVVGSGAREHALAWKLSQSGRLGKLYAAPGNPGMASVAECVPIPVGNLDGLVEFAAAQKIGLVVVGPEVPLAAGLADRMATAGLATFGPTAAAARIESSKAYARDVMTRMGVPQPEYATFSASAAAVAYLDRLAASGATGAVVKASGLAAGKGAIVCETLEAARAAVRELMDENTLGAAGDEVVIEELLEGEEASLFVLTDGQHALPLVPAQDYKRVFDGDAGPNTGGMGSYAPAPVLTSELIDEAMERIVRPTLRGLSEDGAPFQGCLYAGLMKTAAGLKVIEFNCRFGDPETEVVLPLLASDLLDLLQACAEGRLEGHAVTWKSGSAVTVVLASGGYPGAYQTGKPIRGLEAAGALPGVVVFHAGTAAREGEVVTAGGRVLAVSAVGSTFAEAIDRAYAGAEQIAFEGRHYRTDIAARVRSAG